MQTKCAKENRRQTDIYKTQEMQTLPYYVVSTLVSMARYLTDLLVLGRKALSRVITLGAFTMYMNAGNTFHQSLKGMIWNVQDLHRKLSYANEFVVFMECPNAIHHGDILPQTDRDHTIEFRNVSFTYPGSDIRELVYEEYVRLLAVVFQDFELFAFTARENITLTESHAKPRDVLANEEKLEKKLAIVRALYKDAPIVILDEPTAALDPIAEYEIYNQFNALVGGKTARMMNW